MAISEPEALSAKHDLTTFDCGKSALNDWLRGRALSNQLRGFTVVIVVHDAGRVVGFYALAPTAVEPRSMPRRIRTGQPPNPIPCLLLGQLAVDLAYKGKALGKALVADALRRVTRSAELSGGRALVVNAVDEDAASFWRAQGFLASPRDPMQLYRSLDDIRASVQAAEQDSAHGLDRPR